MYIPPLFYFMDSDQEVVRHAREVVGNNTQLDAVVSLYSLSFIWVSEEFAQALQYSVPDLLKVSLRTILKVDRHMLLQVLSSYWGDKMADTRTLRKKDGSDLTVTGTVRSVWHDKEPYLIVTDLTFVDAK